MRSKSSSAMPSGKLSSAASSNSARSVIPKPQPLTSARRESTFTAWRGRRKRGNFILANNGEAWGEEPRAPKRRGLFRSGPGKKVKQKKEVTWPSVWLDLFPLYRFVAGG